MKNAIYLIDPTLRAIIAIGAFPTLEEMYTLLDCRNIDIVRLQETTDVFIVDDMGLFAAGTSFTRIDELRTNNEHMIKGRMLYVGTSHEGKTIFPEETFVTRVSGADVRIDPTKDLSTSLTPFELVNNHVTRTKQPDIHNFDHLVPLVYFTDDGDPLTIKQALQKLNELSIQEPSN